MRTIRVNLNESQVIAALAAYTLSLSGMTAEKGLKVDGNVRIFMRSQTEEGVPFNVPGVTMARVEIDIE